MSLPCDGHDLTQLLQGGGLPARNLFWHCPHYSNQGGFPGGAIRSGPWKLIENHEDGSITLHHLDRDPGERENLAEAEKDRATILRKTLHEWYRLTGAKFLRRKQGGPEPWSPESES